MQRFFRSCLLLTLMVLGTHAAHGAPAYELELEAGPWWLTRNDVQIPNTQEGTRFSLLDPAGKGPWAWGRLYFSYNINSRSQVRVLVAPLSVTERGLLPKPVMFEGETFSPEDPARATYTFNSYRITYSNRIYQNRRWNWRIGFTAKIRDATIRLEQEGRMAEKTNVGFVPLLHVRGEYQFSDPWRLVLDVDALAGGPGRAEDAAIKLEHDFSSQWSAAFGYRTLEGGADVEEVYNFAWLHYLVFSFSARLP